MYYIIFKSCSEVWYWKECRAATLTAAKRAATAEFGGRYVDAVLQVAVGDDITEPRTVVAEKRNAAGEKWYTPDF